MQAKRITVPKAVTIFLSLSVPELNGNTHTVVFVPSLSTTKQRECADRDGWGDKWSIERRRQCFGRALAATREVGKRKKWERKQPKNSMDCSYICCSGDVLIFSIYGEISASSVTFTTSEGWMSVSAESITTSVCSDLTFHLITEAWNTWSWVGLHIVFLFCSLLFMCLTFECEHNNFPAFALIWAPNLLQSHNTNKTCCPN